MRDPQTWGTLPLPAFSKYGLLGVPILDLPLVLVAFLALPSAASAGPVARSSATCSDYSDQADAQRAKDTRDADGDGIYCESLPCPCARPGSNGD